MTEINRCKIIPTKGFLRDLQKAPKTIQDKVKETLLDLSRNPRAKSLRLHPLTTNKKPTTWKIDVFSNKSWQIALLIEGEEFTLLRLKTHKEIQRLHDSGLL